MAEKTGFQQAVIVYRVDLEGNPLDTDGRLISETGNKQAIGLLDGYPNPNPALYEVQFYFTPEDSVDGVPTVIYTDNCATGYIFTTPPGTVALTTAQPSAPITVTSSGPWTADSPAFVNLSRYTGPRGDTVVTLTKTATEGQGNLTFTNTQTGQTATVYVLNTANSIWILASGVWNDAGVWDDTAIWND